MGLSTKQDILAVLYENRAQLKSLGVRRLGLFGSFVRGEQRVDRVMAWDRQDARAASRWPTPGIFDTIRQRRQSRESLRREAALRLRQDIHESRP